MGETSSEEIEKWLAAYSEVAPPREPVKSRLVSGLVYDHHRTTKTGSVVLSFQLGTQEFVAFFNCDVTRRRGPKKGESYATGYGGQFLPPKRGKFCAFWMETVGSPPPRWAAVHKALRPRLKGMQFEGETVVAEKADGQTYSKLLSVRRWDCGY